MTSRDHSPSSITEVDAFLADSVALADGKLYALGAGWNIINTPVIPFRYTRIGIATLIRVPYTATNETHVVECRLEDADGRAVDLGDAPSGSGPDSKIRSIRTEFNVGRPPGLPAGDEQVVPWPLNFDGLVFAQADRYRFVISVDGVDMTTLSFRVLKSGGQ